MRQTRNQKPETRNARADLFWFLVSGFWFALPLVSCATAPKPAMTLDLKITNARIIDGTGSPWYRGDIGVRGDTIVEIGDLSSTNATTTLDAKDNVVSPGFIDLLGQSQYSVFQDPHLEAKVRQGVTSELTGEGTSPGPSKDGRWKRLRNYLDAVDKQGSAINIAMLVGASNPREILIGDVLAICDAGAYGFSMASEYNARLLPPEVMIEGGDARVVRERGTFQDLVRGMR